MQSPNMPAHCAENITTGTGFFPSEFQTAVTKLPRATLCNKPSPADPSHHQHCHLIHLKAMIAFGHTTKLSIRCLQPPTLPATCSADNTSIHINKLHPAPESTFWQHPALGMTSSVELTGHIQRQQQLHLLTLQPHQVPRTTSTIKLVCRIQHR